MPTPMNSKRSLVLCDGDLPSMVALSLTQDAVGGMADVDVLSAPIVPAASDAVSTRIREYADAQAAECSDFPAVAPAALTSGARRNRYLTEAAQQATSGGYAALVCPWLADGFDPDAIRDCNAPPTVESLSRELDRTLLVSRLVTLDASEHGVSVFEVQTPLMDLSDAQVAEMALDLDVPIWRAWWWDLAQNKRSKESAVSARAEALRTRWCTALESLGWSASVEAAASR
ncbi:MAG: hypothetical protein HRU13_11955 [Phycisphaerales bacterium]|nr:hypothetical protein [Phycisphaerales bacterium]